MVIFRKIAAALLATFLFSLIPSLTYMNDSYNFSFYILIFFIYGAPGIFLIGLPFSIGIDLILKRVNLRNTVLAALFSILIYAAAGLLGSYIYWIVLTGELQSIHNYKHMFPLPWFGVVAAMLFYVSNYAVNRWFRRNDRRKTD